MAIQYYANGDANGNIIGYYNTDVWDVSKIPATAIEITEAQWQDSVTNLGKYVISAGTLTLAPAPTAAQQLSSAQTARLEYLNQSFAKAIAAGFPSSADGTARTYAIDPIAMGKWTGTLANINDGMLTANIMVKDISGNKVTLTPSQFKQMAMDGFTYYNNQEQNLWTKEDDVNAATTVTAVNAVTW